MLYRLLFFPAKIFFYFYCRKICINNKNILRSNGPLLIACNHPNSFLDAIIIAVLFKKPVYSLARGDVFINDLTRKLLRSLNILPVYRLSEGVGNLAHNYKTFNACYDIFKQNGIVLIFSEARSINEWKLRPLKKGTARLAMGAWQQNIDLRILPAGINYSNFKKIGKAIRVNFGNMITKEKVTTDAANGRAMIAFNEILKNELQKLVFEMDSYDKTEIKKYFDLYPSSIQKIILFIPAMIGYIFHFPLWYAIHLLIRKRAEDHYDSLMIGILFLSYPLYLVFISLIVFFIAHTWLAFALIILLPITAVCTLHSREV